MLFQTSHPKIILLRMNTTLFENLSSTANTSNVSSIPTNIMFSIYILYIVCGSINFISNFLVFGAILTSEVLRRRKEYVVLGGVAFADALAGAAFICAGAQRIHYVFVGLESKLATSWECMQNLNVLMLLYLDPLSGFMLSCLTIDRLISVAWPFTYYQKDRRYSFKLVGFHYLIGLLNGTAMVLLSYMEPPVRKYPALCHGTDAIGNKIGRTYYFAVRLIISGISIFGYALIPIIYKRSTRRHSECNASVINNQMNVQKRLTITIGISIICLFFFYFIPNFVRVIFRFIIADFTWTIISSYGAIVQNVSTCCNFFLLYMRHDEVRLAVKELILCQIFRRSRNNSLSCKKPLVTSF